jgi:hypothetical protein
MEIFFSYDKKLVIQALRYHFITRPEVRILIILVNVFAIFSAALFYFQKVSPMAFLVSAFLWFVLMVAFWFILPNTVYKRAATFKDSFRMVFTEEDVRLENESGYNSWTWNKFSTFLDSPHFIHLYFDSRSFFLVPKSAVIEAGFLPELRQLLNRKIDRNKKS